MTIQEILDKRNRLINEARGVLKSDKLTAEDRAKYDAIMSDVDELNGDMKRAEKMAKTEEELRASTGVHSGDATPDSEKKRDEAHIAAFRRYLAIGDETELRALSVDLPTEGGYAVPKKLSDMIAEKAKDMTFMLNDANVIEVLDAESLGQPTLENRPVAYWGGEISSLTEDSTMSLGKRDLKPKMLGSLIKASMVFLQKYPKLESWLADNMAIAISEAIETSAMTGNGATEMLGMFTASANGINTDRDYSTGNAETSITADNLIGNFYNIKKAYRNRSKWVGSRAFFRQCAQLKGGDGQYIWRESYTAGQPDTLLGRPVAESEFAPSTFTTGQYVAILGDLKYYQVAIGARYSLQKLSELYARTSQVGFAARTMADGMPIFSEAFSRVKLG